MTLNDVTPTNNPMEYTIGGPFPATFSALFTNLGPAQVSLTATPDGDGFVTVDPELTWFTTGQSVSLLARPGAGRTFLGWSGDATGGDNPLVLVLDQSKSVLAHFSKEAWLSAAPCLGGRSETGFRFSLMGDWGSRYVVQQSSNMVDWTPILELTNSFGTTQLLDPAATNKGSRFYRPVMLP